VFEPGRAVRPREVAIIVLAVLAVVAVNVALASNFYGGPEHHVDGSGPLGSRVGGVSIGFSPTIGRPPWTVGVLVCLAQGNQPAVLDGSVTPTLSVGGGMRYLGAFIHQGGGLVGGSTEGFPPVGAAPLHAVKGFAVTRHCQPADSDPITLLIGFGRDPGTQGGAWSGIDIGYTSGWRHRVVSLQGWTFAVCGPQAPPEACGGSLPPSADIHPLPE
jgi:hypothetical protein